MTRPRPRRLRGLPAAICLSIACSLPLVPAAIALGTGVTIEYQAVDVADEAPGADLWVYRYSVAGFDHGVDHGFSIFFDPIQYDGLSLDGVAATPVGWDAITLQPDPLLPADGLYDALVLSAAAGTGGLFEVSFVWLGVGDPGDQDFVVYDPAFETIGTGRTIVPEPAVAALLLLGFSLLGLHARRLSPRGDPDRRKR